MARAEYCLEVIEQDPIDLRVPCQRPIYFQSGEYIPTTAGGTKDHTKLKNRDLPDQHPMSAITGLQEMFENLIIDCGSATEVI